MSFWRRGGGEVTRPPAVIIQSLECSERIREKTRRNHVGSNPTPSLLCHSTDTLFFLKSKGHSNDTCSRSRSHGRQKSGKDLSLPNQLSKSYMARTSGTGTLSKTKTYDFGTNHIKRMVGRLQTFISATSCVFASIMLV